MKSMLEPRQNPSCGTGTHTSRNVSLGTTNQDPKDPSVIQCGLSVGCSDREKSSLPAGVTVQELLSISLPGK